MTRAALILLSAAVAASAQAAEPWTLDSCIAYAVSHNISVRSRQLDVATAGISVDEARHRFLPAVSAQAGQTFNFGRGLTSNNTYANRNTQNTTFGAGLDLPVFQGLAGVRRLDYARVSLRAAVEQLGAARDNVELNVMSQYLQVLYCGELEAVAAEQARMSAVELERRRQLVEAGKLPELDIYEAQAQLERDRLSVTTAGNDRRLALLELAQMLQLPDTAGFAIAPVGPVGEVAEGADAVYARAMATNHSVLAARLAVDAARANERLAVTGWIPTLSLNAGISANYYKVNGMDNPGFREQMRQNFNKYIGLTLSVPVFDRFNTRNSVRRARVQTAQARLQYEQATTDLYKAIQQARFQADAAEAKLSSASVAEQAGLKAFEGMREKYDFGKATSADYEQARSTWLRSVLEHTQARYELMLRRRILEFYLRH